MKKKFVLIIGILICLILMSSVNAKDVVVSNSAYWETIYSTGIYAALEDKDFLFLTSPKHAQVLTIEMDDYTNVEVIESTKLAFSKNYADTLKKSGYNVKSSFVPERANLEIAEKIKNKISGYIIVDPTLGYDAISVLPYAVKNNYYVLFASKENIDQVYNYLSEINTNLILFGDIDEEVREKLNGFNAEIIHKGSRYKNNLEMVERYRRISDTNQVIFSNGEFLEPDLFYAGKNDQPIMFIGEARPPPYIMDYIQKAGFKSAVVIGNNLVSSAKKIKDMLNIPMFVKFGKGITGGGEMFKDVQGLDMFQVPIIELQLSLENINYNPVNKQIELMIKNDKKIKTYLKNSLLIKLDGELIETLGDEFIQQIGDKEEKGYTYEIDLIEYADRNITVEVFTPYGYSEDEMDKEISKNVKLNYLSIEDDCEISVENAYYNDDTQRFIFEINSNEKCYARAVINELIVQDEEVNIESDVVNIDGEGKIELKQRMDSVDKADNSNVLVKIKYGKRKEVLSKVIEYNFELKGIKYNQNYLTIGLIAIVLILLVLLWRKKKK